LIFFQFDQKLSEWERLFEEWKQKSMNNPDKDHDEKYISDMNLKKNRLLERRRTLQQKVEQ
jgi:hypothetical protein